VLVGEGIARAAAGGKAIILARFIAADAFGLFGIGIIVLTWAERFAQSGMHAALVRKTGDVDPYLDTAWTAQLLRGCAFAVLLFAASPRLASVFEDARATPVIAALAVLFVVRGLASPAVVRMWRALDFKRITQWSLWEVGVGTVVGVWLGILWGDVRALVGSVLAGDLARAVSSYWLAPHRPRLRLDGRRLRELAGFGIWVFLFEITRLVIVTFDGVMVGRLLGAQALGLYQMAERVAFLFTGQIEMIASRVMLPAFAQIGERDRLRSTFVRVLHVAAALAVPTGAMLTAYAEPLVLTLLGQSWRDSVGIVRVIVWCGVARALGGVTIPFFQALGRPQVPFRSTVAGGMVMAVAIVPLMTRWGAGGAAAAVTLGALVSLGWELWVVMWTLRPPAGQLVRVAGTAMAGGLPFTVSGLPIVTAHAPHWTFSLLGAGLVFAGVMAWSLRSYVGVGWPVAPAPPAGRSDVWEGPP
jgi:O-antigen/teichoic acid export membrane protein